MIRVGVIGYGYWGPNLVRNFAEIRAAGLVAVSDLNPHRLALVENRYPYIRATADYNAVINDPSIDAIAVATPVSTHFDLVMHALQAGKHVLVEKPLADTCERALWLTEEAERRGLVLMVDHTFVYTGAVRKVQELISGGTLGEIYYYDSVRVNLGLFQHDVDVIWDLAVHDLSILDCLLPERPVAVSATGMAHVPGKPANIAFLTLFFSSNLIAHLHVNWLSPVKVRKTLIGASRKMVVYDDLEASEKIKVYDKGITVTNGNNRDALYNTLVGYRTGDMWCPKLDATEALQRETEHFVRCIEHGEKANTGGFAGVRVVQLLEAASQSMGDRGRPVEFRRAAVA
jgi:predicted dehydrogenase